jgi:DNA-binding NarL/FixJ family response regulator
MKRSRVLLVDDNRSFLAVLQEFLSEHEGIEVIGAASSGEEALALLERLNPDLMIIDLAMPGMSGLELLQAIRARGSHVTTIVLTLLDTPRHRQAASEAGASAFVAKAYMDADLLPTIHQLLTKSGNASQPDRRL